MESRHDDLDKTLQQLQERLESMSKDILSYNPENDGWPKGKQSQEILEISRLHERINVLEGKMFMLEQQHQQQQQVKQSKSKLHQFSPEACHCSFCERPASVVPQNDSISEDVVTEGTTIDLDHHRHHRQPSALEPSSSGDRVTLSIFNNDTALVPMPSLITTQHLLENNLLHFQQQEEMDIDEYIRHGREIVKEVSYPDGSIDKDIETRFVKAFVSGLRPEATRQRFDDYLVQHGFSWVNVLRFSDEEKKLVALKSLKKHKRKPDNTPPGQIGISKRHRGKHKQTCEGGSSMELRRSQRLINAKSQVKEEMSF